LDLELANCVGAAPLRQPSPAPIFWGGQRVYELDTNLLKFV